MKKAFSILLTLSVFLMAGAAWAAEREETGLERDAAEIDRDGGTPEGERVITMRLQEQFEVDEARISALRSQKMGYGEIAVLLSMAERMPGGITDENVQRIMSMRQGPPVEGWGNIARQLGLKINPVAGRVERLRLESRRKIQEMERTRAREREKMERQERRMERRQERMKKIERPERPETPK